MNLFRMIRPGRSTLLSSDIWRFETLPGRSVSQCLMRKLPNLPGGPALAAVRPKRAVLSSD